MSIFSSLETARRALNSQQTALQTTNHNIANANTKGYSRQRTGFATTPSYTIGQTLGGKSLEVGTGVKVDDINRIRDSFLDFQYRSEIKDMGRWETRRDNLHKLEVIINEPSESGLASNLESFWKGWQELSKSPENNTARSVVLQESVTLTESLKHLDRQIVRAKEDLQQNMQVKLSEVNSLARQIADLNKQIVRMEAKSQKANDLRDKRDLLLDGIAKLAGVSVQERENGAVYIIMGDRGIVEGVNSRRISLDGSPGDVDGDMLITWEDGSKVEIKEGSIAGLMDARQQLESISGDLDKMAVALAREVNAIHTSGYAMDGSTGREYFVSHNNGSITAGNIIVNEQLLENNNLLAAASSDEELPGCGLAALEIAQLKEEAVVIGEEQTTINDYYNSIVAKLGIKTAEAERMTDNQNLLTRQIENQREMISGVNLDEEVANIVRFQHAYNAAARTVTAIDEMLDTIVSRMGLVGR